MKNLVIIMVLAIFFVMPGTFARGTDTVAYTQIPKELKKTLSKQMQYPDIAAENNIEGIVAVCFVITPKGIVKINCINGPEELKEGVGRNLEKLHFPRNLAFANKPMIIKYNFTKQ